METSVNRDDDQQLQQQIQAALNDGETQTGGCPKSHDVEFAARLAAYLDDALASPEKEAFEDHLASCGSCRRLAMESAEALGKEPEDLKKLSSGDMGEVVLLPLSLPTPRSRTAWPLALAAGLAALMAGLWSTRQVESPDPSPVSPESPVSTVAEAAASSTDGPSTEDLFTKNAIQRALQGHLEPLAAFESLLDAGQRPVLRHSATDLGPAPLSPRWTLVSTTRPVFAWRATLPGRDGEIYLVDADETLVAALPFEGSTAPVTRLPLPDDVPDLEPGRLYAWKVNVQYGENLAASDYVPFQVMSGDPASLHVDSATTASVDGRLEHAAGLAADGRLDDALAVLQTLDPAEHGHRAEPLLAAIFEQQQMFPKLERLQRREMGWPDAPTQPPIPGESTP